MCSQNRFFRNILSFVGALALAAWFAAPAFAQGPGVNLAQLAAQVAALQNTVNADHATIIAQQATIENLQTTVNSQATTIAALQAKTAPISIANGVGTGTELFITGVNVHLVDGLGATNGEPDNPFDVASTVTNGLGNLIIGYNTSRTVNGDIDTRTGSHNLIFGDADDYSSFGGIIGGQFNTLSGPYADVLAGFGNQATDLFSIVLTGTTNQASARHSVVVTGDDNKASGEGSAILGGEVNNASGGDATVSGGEFNTASGDFSSVSGGNSDTESTDNGWAGGSLHSP